MNFSLFAKQNRILAFCIIAQLLSACASSPSKNKTVHRTQRGKELCRAAKYLLAEHEVKEYRFIVLADGYERICETVRGTLSAEQPIPVLSASKWVAASVILGLVKDGKLSLEDTTGKWLTDEQGNPWNGPKAKIKLKQLLRFRSGVEARHPCFSDKSISLQDCANQIYRDSQVIAKPGKRFDYGPSHFVIAGAMAEAAAGKSWNDLFEHYLKTPLGLESTAYFYTKAKRLKGLRNPRLDGGLRISYAEYVRFLQAAYDRELPLTEAQEEVPAKATKIGSSRFHREGYPYRYGLGLWLECEEETCTSKAISSPGLFGVYPWLHRERKVIVLLWAYIDSRGIDKSLAVMRTLNPIIREQFPLPSKN